MAHTAPCTGNTAQLMAPCARQQCDEATGGDLTVAYLAPPPTSDQGKAAAM